MENPAADDDSDDQADDRADDYAGAVLALVASIPPGGAMTYGLIAEIVAESLHRGGPRQVGQVLAHSDGSVPWWRVVNAAGSPPARPLERALEKLRAEGCPLTPDGSRVRLRTAIWFPEQDLPDR